MILLYAIFCVWFAWLNSEWIKKGKKVKHFWNGLIHLFAAVLSLYFSGWQLAISVLLTARVAFDWALNLFRGLGLGYVPLTPKSIADKVEKAVFGLNGILPKIIYIIIVICLQTL